MFFLELMKLIIQGVSKRTEKWIERLVNGLFWTLDEDFVVAIFRAHYKNI